MEKQVYKQSIGQAAPIGHREQPGDASTTEPDRLGACIIQALEVLVTNSQTDIKGIKSFVVTAIGDNEPDEYHVDVLDLHLNKLEISTQGLCTHLAAWGDDLTPGERERYERQMKANDVCKMSVERNVIARCSRRAFFEALVSCDAVRPEVFGGFAQFDVADTGRKGKEREEGVEKKRKAEVP